MLRAEAAYTPVASVACIVPTYNRIDSLRNILGLLEQQTLRPTLVLVINDGSTDGTSEFLGELMQDNLVVINGTGNLWWGGAISKGIRYILDRVDKAQYILLLNDDSIFADNYIEEMVRDSQSKLGATVVSPQYEVGGADVIFTGYKVSYKKMEILRTREKDIDASVGRGLLIPISTVKRVGNVKSRLFPHYMGDLEFTARIKEYGFPLVVSEGGKMYSDLADSDGAVRQRGKLVSLLHPRSKINIQNRALLFTVRGPWIYRFTAIPRIMVRGLLRFLRALMSGRQRHDGRSHNG
ncbi:MAG: glycosyltransferase family 2 protein [Acidiferrobacterales bacterium]